MKRTLNLERIEWVFLAKAALKKAEEYQAVGNEIEVTRWQQISRELDPTETEARS